jgi:hypothetical protein
VVDQNLAIRRVEDGLHGATLPRSIFVIFRDDREERRAGAAPEARPAAIAAAKAEPDSFSLFFESRLRGPEFD